MNLPETVRVRLEALLSVPPKLEGRRFLLAVSGGRDSVALLHLSLAAGLPVAVAHLDHGLRETSSLDAAFVRDLAAEHQLSFSSERVDVAGIASKRGWGFEDAARRVRYEFLARSAKKLGCDAILTAHTLEDNAETVLLQLLRGTARASGIPARRGRVLRPLLETGKTELERYLIARNLTWREDESNADQRLNRNWVRLTVLPLLESRFPGASQALSRYAHLSTLEDDFLETAAQRVPDWADWRLEPEVLRRRLLRRTLEAAGVTLSFEHIQALLQGLNSAQVQRFSLPGNRTGVVQSGKLRVFKPSPAPPALSWPDGFDFSAFPWAKLRTRASGDRIRLPGGTRKLSDLLIDHKVPRELRDSLPLVAQNAEVLWVGLEPPVVDVRIAQTRDAEREAMKVALTLAREAFAAGEVPVGAVVICRTESGVLPFKLGADPKFISSNTVDFLLVGKGRNRSRAITDMTAHAELEAIRDACQTLQKAHLTDCTLVVTLEPCLMCLGAVMESRIARVVFAARNPKNGALGGIMDATRADWNHHVSVRHGVLEAEASQLLSQFFAEQRRSEHHQS